jgi:2'-5' RNA ligase
MRLFVAIEVPPAWGEAAVAVTAAITRASGVQLRGVDPARLHLTLRFLGEVPPERLEPLRLTLAKHVPLVDVVLTLEGAGTFGAAGRAPSGRRPRQATVVFLGVGGDRAGLLALATRVEDAVRAAGLPPDERPLMAHLTIARLHRSLPSDARRAVAAAAGDIPVPNVEPTRAREVVLVQSTLGALPRYEVLARVGDGDATGRE